MYRPTISIRAMLCVVAFIGLACVALVRANSIWASVMFTAALAVISFGVLAAILRRGAKQAFWIGFALFGWLYLWMAHWPGDFGSESKLQNDANGTLTTTRLLVYIYNDWLPTARTPPAAPTIMAPTGTGGGDPNLVSGSGMVGGFGGGGLGGFGGGGYGGYGSAGTLTIVPIPTPPAAPTAVISYPAMHEFMRIGHSLFVIVLAFVGGAVAACLYKTREYG